MDAYRKVRDLIRDAPAPPNPLETGKHLSVESLRESCAAIEKSTRILWACAAATNHIDPPLWDYTADYPAALTYFSELDDIELMAITKIHRIEWERNLNPGSPG
jgi:hypothetical protein